MSGCLYQNNALRLFPPKDGYCIKRHPDGEIILTNTGEFCTLAGDTLIPPKAEYYIQRLPGRDNVGMSRV